MSMATGFRPARTDDLPAIERLLRDAQLPLEGARDAFQNGFVVEEDGVIIGAAGLECYAEGALLRSVVVDSSRRGWGLGKRLTAAALEEARRLGLPNVYLLTTTAEQFFPKLGFSSIAREAVPASVQQSIEFRSACPASASVLHLRLK